jgi:hypothetical protein
MRLFLCPLQRTPACSPPKAAAHQEIAALVKDRSWFAAGFFCVDDPGSVIASSCCCIIRGISCGGAAAGFVDAALAVNDAGFSCNGQAFAVVEGASSCISWVAGGKRK